MDSNEQKVISTARVNVFGKLIRRLGYNRGPWNWEYKHLRYWADLVARRYWRMFGRQIKFF